jgi:hypothetical protein
MALISTSHNQAISSLDDTDLHLRRLVGMEGPCLETNVAILAYLVQDGVKTELNRVLNQLFLLYCRRWLGRDVLRTRL